MSIFSKSSSIKPKRSVFDLSHERKLSMQMGDLVPILCEEVIPGDTFRNNTEVLVRLAPMLAPMMHRVDVYTHFFFVPNRLLWADWEKFITGGESGNEMPVPPYYFFTAVDTSKVGAGTLCDHLGFATAVSTPAQCSYKVSALPFRAYQTIYNEFYRDQNLEAKTTVGTNGGSVGAGTEMVLRKRAWEKDYFTSALPWTQRGGEVSIPLMGGDVNLKSNIWGTGAAQEMRFATTGNAAASANIQTDTYGELGASTTSGQEVLLDPNGTLEANFANVVTVNELRRVTKLQQWLERNARGGSRYIEQIFSHFGVRSSDARLQRPEYLGGGKSPIVISEVLQTSKSETNAPQGNLAGHGVSVQNSHRFEKYFEEHGFVIGILSILPKTTYMQGTRRFFFKNDKYDYFWPEFANLGEQPVLKGELYTQHYETTDRETFGYQSRYAEYKYVPSTVHGDFKSSLEFWHMARKFSSMPVLNSTFVQSDPTHRVFAVNTTTVPKLYVQVLNNLQAVRPIPYYSDPSLI